MTFADELFINFFLFDPECDIERVYNLQIFGLAVLNFSAFPMYWSTLSQPTKDVLYFKCIFESMLFGVIK